MGRVRSLYSISGMERLTQDAFLGPLLAFFSLLFIVVELVLLIACANVAGLLLAHTAARRHEIAIRVAIGASRAQLIRQFLAESFLLGVIGTAFGLLMNVWLAELISRVPLPLSIPIELNLAPDFRLLTYTILVGLATVFLCGLTPALQASRLDVVSALKNEDPFSNRRLTLRNCLVVGQVSVSLLLLVTASLFLRNLFHAGAVDPGFDVDHTITVQARLPETLGRASLVFAEQARERLSQLPGIISAGYAGFLPLGFNGRGTAIGREGADQERFSANLQFVGPEYFATLRIPVLHGHEFSASDQVGSATVAVINETLARRYFPGEAPVHKRILYGFDKGAKLLEIVGVVKDSKYATLGEDARAIVYLPWTDGTTVSLVARTAGSPGPYVKTVQQTLSILDRSVSIEVKTMGDHLALAFVPSRVGAVLLGALGALGLALAIIGLYGVVAYVASRRTKEIGIRIALGASRSQILWMVVRDGLALVGVGVGIGTALSLIAMRPLSVLLATGVSTRDPLTLLAVPAILLLVGAAATFHPARRASRVEPIGALRCE